jgi:peptidoglycan hydrolase-like protein with peptidoglycan-binding domain
MFGAIGRLVARIFSPGAPPPALRRGDHGAEVLQLQHNLIALGYPLPRFGPDGDLGDETLLAMAALLRKHQRADLDINVISEDELQLVGELVAQLGAAPPAGPEGVEYHDRRAFASQHLFLGHRLWGEVKAITMHHTACILGERVARWDVIGTHFGITRGDTPGERSKVIQVHPLNNAVVHDHLNSRTVGIEHDGWYAGVIARPETLWQPRNEPKRTPMLPTEGMIFSSRATIQWICSEVARNGGRVEFLFAHRQTNEDRQADPGEAIWESIAMPAMKECGLKHGDKLDFKVLSGRAICREWDERCSARY